MRKLLLVALLCPLLLVGERPGAASIYSQSTMTGTVSLNAGISYPCWPNTTHNTQKCPFPTPPKSAPWGNMRGFGISSTTCVGTYNDIAKAGSVITNRVGTCSFTGTGSIKLDCILGDGTGVASITFVPISGPVVTKTFTFVIRYAAGVFNLTSVGSDLITATLTATVPMTPGNTCLDKTAVTFTYGGGMTMMTLNT